MNLVASVLIVALVLILEHWIPWRKIPGMHGRNVPPRLMAFLFGVVTIQSVLTYLFLSWGYSRAVVAMWAVTVAGGAAVIIAYGVDWLLLLVIEHKELKERERVNLEDYDSR